MGVTWGSLGVPCRSLGVLWGSLGHALGVPWIPLGSLGGPLGVHGRSMDQNSAVAAAGSTFFQKSASRCSPSQATSSRRPSHSLRDAHAPCRTVNYLVSLLLKTLPEPGSGVPGLSAL